MSTQRPIETVVCPLASLGRKSPMPTSSSLTPGGRPNIKTKINRDGGVIQKRYIPIDTLYHSYNHQQHQRKTPSSYLLDDSKNNELSSDMDRYLNSLQSSLNSSTSPHASSSDAFKQHSNTSHSQIQQSPINPRETERYYLENETIDNIYQYNSMHRSSSPETSESDRYLIDTLNPRSPVFFYDDQHTQMPNTNPTDQRYGIDKNKLD
jgi:hypothetical protein